MIDRDELAAQTEARQAMLMLAILFVLAVIGLAGYGLHNILKHVYGCGA